MFLRSRCECVNAATQCALASASIDNKTTLNEFATIITTFFKLI
ncbi:hypothetical protein GPAL_3131 [Glaciecola pallidula DSM 14239 = ACAM 615]|jgi:hypothetical protein|uniref:Uncharacterized protein n=1 Tax=Brumicola pallidula DSM 14239 = ACAM 615 TaxID=1121922 RepID=K6ZI08_9ALTE|nr:hypothetical protein GPAL_3131 [Glaciecola pallidula DSM 14239 = ACAM 615]